MNMNYQNPEIFTGSITFELACKGKFTGKSFENEAHEVVEKVLSYKKIGHLETSI